MSVSRERMVELLNNLKSYHDFKRIFNCEPGEEESVYKKAVLNVRTLKCNRLYFIQGKTHAFLIKLKRFNLNCIAVIVIAGTKPPKRIRKGGITRFKLNWLKRPFEPVIERDFPLYLYMDYKSMHFEDILNGTRTSLKGV